MPRSPKKSQLAGTEMDAEMNGGGEAAQNIEEAPAQPEPSTEKGEYEALCQLVNVIAQPLASRKLAKKIYKLVKKASKQKGLMRQGLVDVQKAVRKDEKGIVVLAGNVSPIDVYSHLPAMCEERGLPYVYTPSREHLGLASGHKRPSIALLIKESEEYEPLYEEVSLAISALVVEVEE